jgi:hypothetical protein
LDSKHILRRIKFAKQKNYNNQPHLPIQQTNQTHPKKQPTKTDPHNFKDENGDWIQSIFSE